jgi:putative ABC transport system substrate-binding protein
MRRRDFIAGIAGSATAWPFVTRTQQGGGMRRIGVLMINPESDSEGQAWVRAFREGLEKLGWAEGRSIRFDLRWSAPGDVEAHRRLAAELVALQPDLILSQGTPSTTALLRQTRTIPVIFGITADPVGDGFVASFPRPGGNATGFIVTEPTIAAKWVELLKEIVPGVTKVAILFNPTTATYADYWLKPFKAAAASFALKAIEAHIRNKSDMEPIVAAEARETNSSMIVMRDPFTQTHRGDHIVGSSLPTSPDRSEPCLG